MKSIIFEEPKKTIPISEIFQNDKDDWTSNRLIAAFDENDKVIWKVSRLPDEKYTIVSLFTNLIWPKMVANSRKELLEMVYNHDKNMKFILFEDNEEFINWVFYRVRFCI